MSLRGGRSPTRQSVTYVLAMTKNQLQEVLIMLTFRDITLADRDLVMPMVQAFYQTDAVAVSYTHLPSGAWRMA